MNHALTTLRLHLHRNGYRPVPVSNPNALLEAGGKAPLFRDWRKRCATADEAEVATWATAIRDHGNTGLLCGEMIAADLDVPDPDLAAEVEALADTMLPPTPLVRIGKAPKSLRCYRAGTTLAKMATPELLLDDGTKVQVEIMAAGQQVVGLGTHPGTKALYLWPDKSPGTVPLAELPLVTADTLQAFVDAAEDLLRAAGGGTKKERKADDRQEEVEAKAERRRSNSPSRRGTPPALVVASSSAPSTRRRWTGSNHGSGRRGEGADCDRQGCLRRVRRALRPSRSRLRRHVRPLGPGRVVARHAGAGRST